MFCTRCGAQNAENARFCTSCGGSLELGGPQNSGGQGYPGGAAYSAPRKRLHRVLEGKKIAGVCTGFAEYFDMDVTLVRLIWVAMVLIPPSIGLVVYLVAWIVLPRD
ncbi:MAG TPA: PspC domain-containing protein [Bryobacteraceae bacterium]|jgi:phage shock protein C|nr:PspC domain-containing protein [Bryobacteraceae bacterium]